MLLFVSSYIFIGQCIYIFPASYINSLPERNYETGQIFANAGENALLKIFLQKACRWFFQIDKRLSEYSEPSDWPSDGRLTRWNKRKNKTQCQLCKRLAGPFIPLSWSCLVWKRVSLWMWSLRGSQQTFFCVFGRFRHGDDKETNKQPGDPSASLLLVPRPPCFWKQKQVGRGTWLALDQWEGCL